MKVSHFTSRFFLFSISALAILAFVTIPALAQREETESTPLHEALHEDHAAQAAEWFENYTNPTHDPNVMEHRLQGLKQLHSMSNAPAMKMLSTPAWVMAGTSQVPKGSQTSWVSGRGQCVASDAHGTIYYGAPISGLWKTNDHGGTWTPLSDGWATPVIGAVAVDTLHPNVVYAGTGCVFGDLAGGGPKPGVGVYKTTDGGTNWTLVYTNTGLVTCGLIVNPANTNLIYLATTAGVMLSKDAGATWNSTVSIGAVNSLVIDPIDPSILYVAGNNQIQKSTDSGKTWTKLKGFVGSPYTMTLSISPKNHLFVYLSSSIGGYANGTSTLSRTEDGGTTWKTLSTTVNYLGMQGFYANSCAADPSNADNVVVGGLDIYSFSNAGATNKKLTDWTAPASQSNFAHADIHTLVYIGDTLFTLSDGGIYYSLSNGNSWDDQLNRNLPTLQFVGGDAHLDAKGNPTTFVAGAQDNGLNSIAPLQTYWTQIKGGDGGFCYISADGKTVYGTYVNNSIFKSVNGGASWIPGPGSGQPGVDWNDLLIGSAIHGADFYMQYDVADDDAGVVAMCGTDSKGKWNLFLTTDGFQNLPGDIVPVAGPSSTNPISGSPKVIAFAGSNTIFIGTTSNTMYYSNDEGSTWTKTTTTLGATPTGICTKPYQYLDQNVYMSVAKPGKFMRSMDGGATWTKPDTNLPSGLNYVSVAASNNIIFLAHEYGVLYSSDQGVTWYTLGGSSLPQAQIMKLKVRGHYLIATTYGRGMYYIDIGGVGGVASESAAPASAAITAIYPNPVVVTAGGGNHTSIRFSVNDDSRTTIGVYDVLGRQEHMLLNEWETKGDHEITSDLSTIPAGQHYLMLTSGGTSVTKPITIE